MGFEAFVLLFRQFGLVRAMFDDFQRGRGLLVAAKEIAFAERWSRGVFQEIITTHIQGSGLGPKTHEKLLYAYT
jgi:hypothetical protein